MNTETMVNIQLGWHFVGKRLRDEQPIPPDGETLVYRSRPILCHSGYHASRRIIDALNYAPGNTICRVRLGGTILEKHDKLVATERTILWRIDGEQVLRDFVRKCALAVIHLWDAPAVVIRYLKTGDPAIRRSGTPLGPPLRSPLGAPRGTNRTEY